MDDRPAESAAMRNRGQNVAPDRAIQAPGIVEHDDISRRHVVDVVTHVASLHQARRPVAQRKRPSGEPETGVERRNPQTLADDPQSIQRI